MAYLLNLAIYRLVFSALARYPGPKLWALTRLPYIVSLVRGNLAQEIRKIHEEYGDAVRIAPDEVSFATPDAWHDIYTNRLGQKPFAKNPLWYKPPPGQVYSFPNTPSHTDHARMQGLLKGSFTEKALQDQERVVQSYVDLLISSLRDKASSDTCINMVHWLNYTTFDIFGDLAFGEPFDCLRNSAYHPWVSMIFDSLVAYVLAAATRFYPLVETVLMRLVPKNLIQNAQDHHQLAVDKVHRRLNLETQRHDFMTPIIEMNTDMREMSLPEIESTFSLLVIAGSETTATTLSGITNHIIQDPSVMQTLASEVRDAFKDEKDMTMQSVKGLPYLNAVISEGLRVCNPVTTGLPRLVPAGGNTICGRWLPGNVSPPSTPISQPLLLTRSSIAQTHVSVHSYTISRSARRFHRPEAFVPERWLPNPSRPAEYASDQLSALFPFSIGPRRCIGQNLAMFEMRMILARLVWVFDMEAVQGSILDWRTLKSFNFIQKQPVVVRLKARVGT